MFDLIISLENLFLAWGEFRRGKRNKPDVREFEFCLEDNLFQLYGELKAKTYKHSNYSSFYIRDPKLRHIHKATARDRILHHAVFRILYPIFDKGFIFDSYSCRIGKGTHKAVNRLEKFARKLSKNNRLNIFVLKCDIRKFFDSVNHDILLKLITKKVRNNDAMWLVKLIIKSYEKEKDRGLPLGNVTSQLFANIYLNELDQFIKHNLKVKYYVRYTDDFVILADNERYLKNLIHSISGFLRNNLDLNLHPSKISIRKFSQGIDFLGYALRPYYCLIRTKTKKRIFKKIHTRIEEYKMGIITENKLDQCLQSYLGVLSYANTHKLSEKLKLFSARERRQRFGKT